MKIGKVEFYYPCFGRMAEFSYVHPRKSHVLEWVFLEILKVAKENRLEDSIAEIFSQKFGITEADILVRDTINELIDWKAIKAEDFSDGTKLEYIPANSDFFSLTSEGEKLHENGRLPGKSQNEKVYFFRDAFDLSKICDERNNRRNSTEDPGDLICTVENSKGDLTLPVLKNYITKYTKLIPADAQFIDINFTGEETESPRFFKKAEFNIELNDGMEIVLNNDKGELHGNEYEVLFGKYFSAADEKLSKLEFEGEMFEKESTAKIFLAANGEVREKLCEFVKECFREEKSFIVDSNFMNEEDVAEIAKESVVTNKNGKMLVFFSNAKKFQWKSDGKNCKELFVPKVLLEQTEIFMSEKKLLSRGQSKIHSGEFEKCIVLGLVQDADKVEFVKIIKNILQEFSGDLKQGETDVIREIFPDMDLCDANKMNSTYKNIYIIDTNILMESLEDFKTVFADFSDTQVIFPTAVLEELDRHKKNNREKAQPAISFIHDLKDKVAYIEFENSHKENLPEELQNDSMDNLILSIAIEKQNKYESKVYLITNDKNLRNKACSQNVNTKNIKTLLNDMKTKQSKQRGQK